VTFRLKSPELTEAQVSAAFFRLLAAQPWAVHVQIPRARIPRKASSAVRRAAEKARVDWYAQIVERLRDRPACLAFWRSNTGAGQIGTGGRFVEFGLWGQPDVEGVFSPLGLRVGIELKRKSTYLSPQQKIHRDLLLASGAIHVVAREPREGVEDLRKALSERLGSDLGSL
tara:strand:+ start:254 stop:766 length:513 start_codon:yes stop_codon:yes gene_type:complete